MAPLPPANITGPINMSGTNGKIALVNSFDALAGNCPIADPHVMDFVGYGSADCREGTATAPSPSNTRRYSAPAAAAPTPTTTQRLRHRAPTPRRTAPIVETRSVPVGTDPPQRQERAARRDIMVTFTEPVDVVGAWFDITCAASGLHNSATPPPTARTTTSRRT